MTADRSTSEVDRPGRESASQEQPPAAPSPSQPGQDGSAGGWSGAWLAPLIAPLAFGLVFIFYATWLGGTFLNANTRILDLHQNTPVLLIALGLTMALIAGQFDLSVGSMATLTAFLSVGLMTQQGWAPVLALLACLAVAIIGGLFNALLVVGLRVNAFIATLGTGGVFLGLSAVYSKGTSIVPGELSDKGTLPSWFTGPGSITSFQEKVPVVVTGILVAVLIGALVVTVLERVGSQSRRRGISIGGIALTLVGVIVTIAVDMQIPWTVLFLLVCCLALWVLLRYTVLGRHLYAIGGNSASAMLAGVRVNRGTTFVFVTSAVMAGLAGVILGGNQGAASPNVAVSYLLPAFAAGFLSTVLFSNGRFHVWGTVLGGYLIIAVSQGLVTGGVPFTWNEVINGAVLIGAVAAQSYFSAVRRA